MQDEGGSEELEVGGGPIVSIPVETPVAYDQFRFEISFRGCTLRTFHMPHVTASASFSIWAYLDSVSVSYLEV